MRARKRRKSVLLKTHKKTAQNLKFYSKNEQFGTIFDRKTTYNIKIMTTHPCPLNLSIVTARHAVTHRVS